MPEPTENKDDLFEEDQVVTPADPADADEDLFDDEEGEEQKPAPKAPAPQPQEVDKIAKALERKAIAYDKLKEKYNKLKETSPVSVSETPVTSAPVVDAEAIARKVREDLEKDNAKRKEEEYEEALKAQIRTLPNMTKELAREIFNTAKGIPSRADASKSVSFAYNWVMQANNPQFSTTPAPINGWASSVAPTRTSGSPTDGQKELGKLMGLSEEELNKLNGKTPSIFNR